MAVCHEFFMGFPIITFFWRVMSIPLWETSLCPAWLTRNEIPRLQMSSEKQNRFQTAGWGTTSTPAGEVNRHFWSPITHSDEKRVHVATFIRGNPGTGMRFGAFSIIQHTFSLYSELQMLAVCCFDESYSDGTREECLSDPRCDRDFIRRLRLVPSWGQWRVMRIKSPFPNMPSSTFEY